MKNEKKNIRHTLIAGVCLCMGSSIVNAEPLTIKNPSFEDTSPANWVSYPKSGKGWCSAGSRGGAVDASSKIYASDGSRVAFITLSKGVAGWISQELGQELTPNKIYTLSVDVTAGTDYWSKGAVNDGINWHIHNIPYEVILSAGSTILAKSSGTFDFQPGDSNHRKVEVVYMTAEGNLPEGNLKITLTAQKLPAEGWQPNNDSVNPSMQPSLNVFYDNVHLEMESVVAIKG